MGCFVIAALTTSNVMDALQGVQKFGQTRLKFAGIETAFKNTSQNTKLKKRFFGSQKCDLSNFIYMNANTFEF